MDLQKFIVNISDQLKDQTVGWAAAVYQGTDLRYSNSGGKAILTPSDQNDFTYSYGRHEHEQDYECRSGRRLIPLQIHYGRFANRAVSSGLLREGPTVEKLTFRMLMTQTTGLKGVAEGPDYDSASFANLEKMIANGVTGNVPGMVSYLNEGYALLRIILPYLWNGPDYMDYSAAHYPESFIQLIDNQNVDLCKSWILANPSLKEVSIIPTGPQPYTRLYNFQNTNQSRASGTMNDIFHAGHDHWYMSAREYGRLIVDLRLGTYVAGTSLGRPLAYSGAMS